MGRTRAGNASANKQHGLLSVRSVVVLSGVEVRVRGGGKKGGGGCGATLSTGTELRGRSYAGVFSHSVWTGVICALGLLLPKTQPCSATVLMVCLSKPLNTELVNTTSYAEGKHLSLLQDICSAGSLV